MQELPHLRINSLTKSVCVNKSSILHLFQKLSTEYALASRQLDVWEKVEADQEDMETWLNDIKAKLDDAVSSNADINVISNLLHQYEVIISTLC